MKLVRVESIPEPNFKKTKENIFKIMEDFITSDMQYAEVVIEDGEYCRVESARQSLISAVKTYGFAINVMTRDGKLYLAKKEA